MGAVLSEGVREPANIEVLLLEGHVLENENGK
jgi:hypothetical protein